ncbi:DUF3873 family protein [Prosthecochloris sp.]|uniref:DUF3873 family protein n=1 Tax=Prosthecochloris sp. TaxID=290513 RepID=UPI0025FADFD4|nr:DUF3873 family protein [Prosthecochloris sp.]
MTDLNGCSTCQTGQEQIEYFTVDLGRKGVKEKVQYDYRHTDGELFSCIADNIALARSRRDVWLQKKAG